MTNSCAGVSLTVAMALLCPIAVRAYWTVAMALPDDSYGCVMPKLCGHIEAIAMALLCQSRAGVSLTVAMALSHQSCAGVSFTVAMAFARQSCADGS